MLERTRAKIVNRGTLSWLSVWLLFGIHSAGSPALACPFCEALAASFREELSLLDYVALARCRQAAAPNAELPIHSFKISKIYKAKRLDDGTKLVTQDVVRAYSRHAFNVGDIVLMFGVGVDNRVDWAPSEPLSSSAIDYVDKVAALEGEQNIQSDATELGQPLWLDLFWQGLVSSDDWVRKDAYNALATVSLKQLRPWAKHVNTKELKQRLARTDIPVSHRRFYWTIMGLCGSKDDVQFVRKTIFAKADATTSDNLDRDLIGLDAAISCFLLLGGQDALEEVTGRLLKNQHSEVSARFAALSALRVHTEEFEVLDREKICTALAELLDDSAFATVVIPDLARLEDWRHVETLLRRFRSVATEEQYIRIPIINYLRRCPLPAAKSARAECQRVDPDAYRRAETIFPLPAGAVDGN